MRSARRDRAADGAPSRAWAAVIGYSADEARAAELDRGGALAIRSIQCAVRGADDEAVAALVGHHARRWARSPAISIVTCGTSGKARPMPSASTTGRPDPRRPADRQHAVRRRRSRPPSAATTGRPVTRSRLSRSQLALARRCRASRSRRSARRCPPQGMIRASSGRSSRSTSSTGPNSLDRVRAGEQAGVGVAAAAGAQHGAPARQRREGVDVDPHRGIVSHVRPRPIG